MLIEALIAILIFSIGIPRSGRHAGHGDKNVTESKSRSEAAFLAEELMAQMWIDQNISSGASRSMPAMSLSPTTTMPGQAPPPRDWERSRHPDRLDWARHHQAARSHHRACRK